MTTTHTHDVGDAALTYDVHEPVTPSDGPPLVMIGAPMAAGGFDALATYFTDRTVITYDPRGLGRSTRSDDSVEQSPSVSAADLHSLLASLGGPVEMFASSGGAVNALALVATHPDDVSVLVAHEPPMLTVLPDADLAFAVEARGQEVYRAGGWGAGLASFIAMTSWQGEFTDEFLTAPPPDPAGFGLPTEDHGNRDDPLLSGVSNAVTAYVLDTEAVWAASTRVVVAAGVESRRTITWRTSEGVAAALGLPVTEFPSHHGGFLGEGFGQPGQPEAFAARLREALAGGC